MKKYLLLFILLPFLFAGTPRYVKNVGNDTLDGTTNDTAWASITKVNNSTLSGDDVYFLGGDVFRGQIIPINGTSSDATTYQSYGTGKAYIYGSKEENAESDWVDQTGNIWFNNDTTFNIDVGNIIFNDTTCGVKKQSLANVTSQGDFFYNFTTDSIQVYSVGNPTTVYSDIECALMKHIISEAGKNNIEYKNLYLKYGAAHGIGGSVTNNITVSNLNIDYIGGGDISGNYTSRYGNAVEFLGNCSDNLVENCYIDNIYDAGLTSQGNAPSSKYNITFKNNIITNCEFSLEDWNRDPSSIVEDVKYIFNTCLAAGSGWGHTQRWDSANGRHIMNYWNSATMLNKVQFKYNIFDTATESAIWIYTSGDSIDYDIDNNIFNCTTIGRYSTTDYISLEDWQTATSQDLHSISQDPLIDSTGFPYTNSPVIDAGTDIGVDTDYRGVSRSAMYDGDLPDIGAYERKKKMPQFNGHSNSTWTTILNWFNSSQ